MILSIFKFWRARDAHGDVEGVNMLAHDLKFMCIEFDQFMINGYEDMNDNVKTQNGAWMMSLLSDQAEFVGRSIPDHGQDCVKFWIWLLIPVFWDILNTKFIQKEEINK